MHKMSFSGKRADAGVISCPIVTFAWPLVPTIKKIDAAVSKADQDGSE
jgi:hypothetical protein